MTIIDEIERLRKMLESGHLSTSEFEQAKAKLIQQMDSQQNGLKKPSSQQYNATTYPKIPLIFSDKTFCLNLIRALIVIYFILIPLSLILHSISYNFVLSVAKDRGIEIPSDYSDAPQEAIIISFCYFIIFVPASIYAYYGIFYTKSWAPFFLIIVWALSLSSALLDLSFFSFEWRIMNDLSSFYTIIDTLILSLVLFSPASSYYQNELYSNKQNGEIL